MQSALQRDPRRRPAPFARQRRARRNGGARMAASRPAETNTYAHNRSEQEGRASACARQGGGGGLPPAAANLYPESPRTAARADGKQQRMRAVLMARRRRRVLGLDDPHAVGHCGCHRRCLRGCGSSRRGGWRLCSSSGGGSGVSSVGRFPAHVNNPLRTVVLLHVECLRRSLVVARDQRARLALACHPPSLSLTSASASQVCCKAVARQFHPRARAERLRGFVHPMPRASGRLRVQHDVAQDSLCVMLQHENTQQTGIGCNRLARTWPLAKRRH